MSKNQTLLNNLQKLLKQKKSKAFYAEKLNVSIDKIVELLQELRKPSSKEPTEYHEVTTKVDVDKGTLQSTRDSTFDPRTVEELAQLHKIDLKQFKITNYWSKLKSNGKFTSSVFATKIQENSREAFQDKFLAFLQDFTPSAKPSNPPFHYTHKENISLILPKQDAHFNKFSVNGDNCIKTRFIQNENSVWKMLKKAEAIYNIEEVVYIVGSDQFNSEWTSATTKGTPQENIHTYQEAFELITDHEINIIKDLLDHSERVKVVFVPGNHDQYVGWHLVNLLKVYFRKEGRISFDDATLNTKYHKYGNTAIMLNHGDAIKPKELAHIFPIGFKEQWSLCENYVIITGDKHHELALDISGIKFYQIPQLSSAVSKWDDKMGYRNNKAEMVAFVVTETNGISDIYKEIIN